MRGAGAGDGKMGLAPSATSLGSSAWARGTASVKGSGCMAPKLSLTCFSPEDKQDCLLRGVPLTAVMRRCGALFASADGTAASYRLSQGTTFLDTFISHNWCTSRAVKFVALAMHLNFDAAAVVTCVVTFVLGLLQILGVLWVGVEQHNTEPYSVGLLCRVSSLPVFLAVLVFWRDVVALLGCSVPLVFVDKACIHQTDPAMKLRGISKLGAFIGVSRKMVVLYSDIYFFKLWTTYEVASFLVQHPLDDLRLLPVRHAITYLCVICWFYFMTLLILCLNVFSRLAQLRYIVDTMGCVGGMLLWRRWFRHRNATSERVRSFSIRHCRCAVESDRPAVNHNVAVLVKAYGLVGDGASEEDALDAFDRLVRGAMGHAFSAVLSARWVYQLRHYWFFGFIVLGTGSLDYLSKAAGGAPWRLCLATFAEDLFWATVGWPGALLWAEVVAGFRVNVCGWRELVLAVASTCVLILLPGLLLFACTRFLSTAAKTSDLALATLFGLSLVGCGLLVALVRPRPRVAQRASFLMGEAIERQRTVSFESGCLSLDRPSEILHHSQALTAFV